ncbi:MAG: aldo/keto reductase [Methylacidiphilales bacterium]|nr:aldo/keto reductase [Candidatus Methylacidiphilales bacterium]
MEYTKLGRTGLKVSRIGFGGFGIGGGYLMQDKNVALRAIEHAFHLGVNYFDTAPFIYNDSETLLGKALKGKRDKVVLATKVEKLEEHSIRECVETSLKQLQTDYLDILQWRDPTAEALDRWHFREICEELKSEGKLRFEAVTIGDAQQLAHGRLGIQRAFPVIQLAYNLIFHQAETELLPEALKENIGIVVRGPLCKGFLADRLTAKPAEITGHPNFRWFTAEEADTLLSLQEELRFLVVPGKRSLAQAALRFTLQHPAVCTVIPSMETPEDVDELVEALNTPLLTHEEIQKAKSIIARFPSIDY